jgi:NCS1 family nucleobase:cation symporter-1
MLRALVACGWFGIQTWIGGWAIYKILEIYFPSWSALDRIPGLGINAPELACFLFFWGINLVVIYLGIESIRFLLNIKAPLLIALGLALLAWAVYRADGFGPILSQQSRFEPGGDKAGQFWKFFIPALTGAVGYWATLSLNIPDFTRYARSQRDQVLGQALGLPTTMALYSFIGVAVTSAAILIYPETPLTKLWDPIVLISKFTHPFILIVALLGLSLATLATNIAANVVSPANDFSNLWPKMISFRTGGLITALVGVLMQPWHLYQDPSGYIFKWLIAYSSLLGAVGGILIADYYFIRRTELNLPQLYASAGRYWYTRGFHPPALIALIAGVGVCVPGFLATVGWMRLPENSFWVQTYHYAWFISFAVSLVVYTGLMAFRSGAQRAHG